MSTFKSGDLYNIGRENSEERKGTGNYDKARTVFNHEYVGYSESNLYQAVKTRLKDRKIEYSNKKNTNMMKGLVFTSGPEFFESLGMKFVDSGRVYQTGDKKGLSVKVPVINGKEDIPQAVTYFFDSCMEFLKDYVGEENILLSTVHYDEDTPHLQAYFLPVVNQARKKVFEKDSEGNIVKVKATNKKGAEIFVPKALKDDKGKNVYEIVDGLFLNDDQFSKQKGGKNSYRSMLNSFHEFITARGFNLDRGKIGASVEHKTKLEWQIEENKAELKELEQQKESITKKIKNSKDSLKKANKNIDENVLNPKYNAIRGFNKNDVEKLKDYSSNLTKINNIQNDELMSKDELIAELMKQIKSFRDSDEIKLRNQKLIEQHGIIKKLTEEVGKLKELVNILENNIESLKQKFDVEINKWKEKFKTIGKALCKKLGIEPKQNLDDYKPLAEKVLYGRSKDDYEIER